MDRRTSRGEVSRVYYELGFREKKVRTSRAHSFNLGCTNMKLDLQSKFPSAHAMAGEQKKCLEAGCDVYATKPIDRTLLIEIAKRHEGHSQLSHNCAISEAERGNRNSPRQGVPTTDSRIDCMLGI